MSHSRSSAIRRRICGPLLLALVLGLLLGPSAVGRSRARVQDPAQALARQLSLHPPAESSAWRSYDEAPADALVHPVRVIDVQGAVSDPQALAAPDSGRTTTLTDSPGSPAPSLVLDYGKEVGGYGTFDVAATTGTTIKADYSETLANLGNDGSATSGAFFAGNAQRTDSFPTATGGVVTAQVIQGGERYERVTLSSPGSVTLRSAGIDFAPLRETPGVMQGHFLSSDPLLNRIWYSGAYTLNLNQMTPGTTVLPGAVNQLHLILDGAKRDRAVWSGDHLISDLTDYYVSDSRYARDSNQLFLEHPASSAGELQPTSGQESQPGPLPGACTPNPQLDNECITWSATYSMVVMSALENYYLYTGDLGFIRRHWQSVVRQMQWDAQQVDANGLFSVDSSDDADWNIENVAGELTYANAVYEEALRSAARLAAALGDRADALSWARSAQAIRSAVNAKLWDARTGVYDASTSQRGSVVQDANVTAILAGIPSPARARSITRVLARALRTPFGAADVSTPVPSGYNHDVSPYMGSFHVLADFQAGNEAAALALIRQEWGFMVGHDPGGVDWERIQLPSGVPAGGSVADSTAHAWSTGPTAALSEFVLGVAPTAPGYASWSIAPQPGDLGWAQGVVPTPHGTLTVRWQREDLDHDRDVDSFVLSVIVPSRTPGSVSVPLLGAARAIAEDGRLVWGRGVPRAGGRTGSRPGYVTFEGVRGRHTFAWSCGRC